MTGQTAEEVFDQDESLTEIEIDRYREKKPETFGRYLSRRRMIFIVAFVGYVCAYLVRNNFKLMSKSIMYANDWDKTQIAVLLSCLTITYGLAKFFMGAAADRVSIRKLFAGCLGAAAVVCIIIGFFNTSFIGLAILLVILGIVQGATAPASQTMLANWYPNKTRGGAIAGWNVSQNVGAALLPLIIAGLTTMGWVVPVAEGSSAAGQIAMAFLVPGVLVLIIAAIFWRLGGDSPQEEGLDSLRTMYGETGEPNVGTEDVEAKMPYFKLVGKYVFGNPALLLVAAVNVALYFVRFGIEDWMPIYLHDVANVPDVQVQVAISVLEWIAIPGSLVFAWLAVKFPNKMAKIGAVALFGMAVVVIIYERLTATGAPNYILLLVVSGILGAGIYGPQLIVNILTVNFVPLNVAGTAIGFVGVTAYLLGNMGSNWVMPLLADSVGWVGSYIVVAALAAFSAVGYLLLARRERQAIKA